MTPADVILALGLFLLSLGIGWLLYRTRMERAKANALPAVTGDPIAPLRETNAEIQTMLREGAVTLERVRDSVKAGVR